MTYLRTPKLEPLTDDRYCHRGMDDYDLPKPTKVSKIKRLHNMLMSDNCHQLLQIGAMGILISCIVGLAGLILTIIYTFIYMILTGVH